MNDSDRRQLRRRMRQARRSITPDDRARAERAINEQIISMPQFRRAGCIALYSAFDGEPDVGPAVDAALELGKQVCLPVLPQQPGAPLTFAPVTSNGDLRSNRFGIAEPLINVAGQVLPDRLDLVIVPLVAFDADCNRLGMGAGYYDRTFAFVVSREPQTPRLVGVAFDLQKHNALDPCQWDVPLWSIVTENQRYQHQATEN